MNQTIIGIQQDNQDLSSNRQQSFSKRWHELGRQHGIETRNLNIYTSPDSFFDQLNQCTGFMWWYAQPLSVSRLGHNLIMSLGHATDIPTFPNRSTIWHFDDKIAQYYLLRTAQIPTPKTWILWSHQEAKNFIFSANFPLVLKLKSGIVSRNVQLIHSAHEAMQAAKALFGYGMYNLPPEIMFRWTLKRIREALRVLRSEKTDEDFHKGYLLFQEFLPNNDFDIRITVIGNRAFAFRRFNRPNDFRASGSGRIDWDHTQIPEDAIQLAFQTAKTLRCQSLAVDILRRNDQPVIAEISYYYEGWAVEKCPGHWAQQQNTNQLNWIPGEKKPEDAIWEDFVKNLR